MAKGGAVLIGSLLGIGALGGAAYLLATQGNVEAKVSDFSVSPVSAKSGDSLAATITWANTGKLYSFDVIIFFGDLANMDGFGGLLPKVRPIPRVEKTSVIQVTVPSGVAAGQYDVSALICDAVQGGDGTFTVTKTYAVLTKQGLLTITGGEPPPPPSGQAEVSTFSMAKA